MPELTHCEKVRKKFLKRDEKRRRQIVRKIYIENRIINVYTTMTKFPGLGNVIKSKKNFLFAFVPE